MVETQVKRWGNSLALRIPKPFADEVGLEEDALVELTVVDGALVVAPASELSLEKLLEQVTEENRHPEIDSGPAIGKEVW